MKTALALLSLALLLPLPAAAADEPEVVYGKFHRALLAGDVGEMQRYAVDAYRAELAAMSPAQREAQAKMAGAMMPRGFLLRNKTVAPGGQSARLIVSGPGQPLMGDRPETLYGTIQMVMQRGEWKVGESDWTNQQPAALTQPARPAAKAGAQPAAPISTRSTPVVGSMD